MKKILFFVSLCLLIGGCGTQEGNKEEVKKNKEEKKTIKIDKDKDYFYVSDTYTVPINDEQKEYLEESLYTIDSIVVNIDSDDATKVQDELNQMKNNAKNKQVIRADGVIGEFMNLHMDAYSNDKYATLLVSLGNVYWQSEGIPSSIIPYTFDLKKGNLISKEQLLKDYGYTLDSFREKVININEAEGRFICEEAAELCKVPENASRNGYLYSEDLDVSTIPVYLNKEGKLVTVVKVQQGIGSTNVDIIVNK